VKLPKFFQLLRKQLRKTPTSGGTKDEGKEKALRDLLDRSIESKGVVDIFQSAGIQTPDISILDEAFLGEFKSRERRICSPRFSRTKFRVGKSRTSRNTNRSRRCSNSRSRNYHNRAIQAADVVRVLIQIKQDMARESERTKALCQIIRKVTVNPCVAKGSMIR